MEATVYQFRLRKRRVDGTELWSCMGCEETGWHNSSIRYKFSAIHLRLAKFLCELQVLCHDVDDCLKELLRGEQPKARSLMYIRVANDARIQNAKLHFGHI